MSFPPPSARLAVLRDDAQLLVEQTGDQEEQLEALVALAERDLRRAQAAMSGASRVSLDQVRHFLSADLQRSTTAAATARRLSLGAHLQHVAACRLFAEVADDPGAGPCSKAVLVVDDSGEIRDVLTQLLEDAGFVVETAANGLEGLIAAYEMRPTVIIMDVSMPVLDGVEATRLIKATKATRDARVIAYTGNPSFEASPTRQMFAAVLTKPSAPDAVLATVHDVAGL